MVERGEDAESVECYARKRPRTPPIGDRWDRQSASEAPSTFLLPTALSQQLLAWEL